MASSTSAMTSHLTSLPLELLMNVALFLPAPSVLKFALTSRKLYDAAQDALRRQTFLHARYNMVVINCNLDPRDVDGRPSLGLGRNDVEVALDMADAPLTLKAPLSPQSGGNSTVLTSNGVASTTTTVEDQATADEEDYPEAHMPPNYFRSPITLLYHLRHNPDLTYHINDIHFRASDNTTSSPLDARLWAELVASHLDGFLRDAAPWLGYTREDRDMWRADIEGGNHGTALALLLSFLPNVKGVALSGLVHTYSCWLDMLVRGVNSMVTEIPIKREHDDACSSSNTTTLARPAPLSKINTLHIDHIEPDPQHQAFHGPSGISLHSLLPLTQLPSIRHLIGSGIAGYDIFHAPVAVGFYKSQRTSPLHTVELSGSAISPANLARFIRPMKELQKLTYEWGGAEIAGPRNMNMRNYRREFMKETEQWLGMERLLVDVSDEGELVVSRLLAGYPMPICGHNQLA